MSLRSFHFVFIAVSILLSAGLAYLGLSTYQSNNERAALIFGSGSAVAFVVLVIYGIWFIRKSRKIIL
jgi:hypothetical protein